MVRTLESHSYSLLSPMVRTLESSLLSPMVRTPTFLLLYVINLLEELWLHGSEVLVEGEDHGVDHNAPAIGVHLVETLHKHLDGVVDAVGQGATSSSSSSHGGRCLGGRRTSHGLLSGNNESYMTCKQGWVISLYLGSCSAGRGRDSTGLLLFTLFPVIPIQVASKLGRGIVNINSNW